LRGLFTEVQMTTRVEDLLVRVRDSLADEDKSRWSDSRLLRLVDEAQKKIATKCQLLRRYTTISILANKSEYELPEDAYLITRAVDEKGRKIDVKSHADMDDASNGTASRSARYSSYQDGSNINLVTETWELDTGSKVEYLVFDNQEPGWFKTYPIVNDVDDGEVFVTPDYGLTADIESDILSSPYGVVVDVTTNALQSLQMNSVYGVVTAMSEVIEILRIYYRAKPTTITAVTDLLEIDDKWDAAMKHYVISMALHDDQDTQNRAVSSDEMTLFGIEFKDAKKISSKDNMSRSNNRSSYNPEI